LSSKYGRLGGRNNEMKPLKAKKAGTNELKADSAKYDDLIIWII
jgi:hypothetical protein